MTIWKEAKTNEISNRRKAQCSPVFGCGFRAAERKDGYLIGNGWLVSWCVGHLIELAQPEAYGEQYAKWRYEDLPILPTAWKYEVSSDKKKQFRILRELMNDSDVDAVVCATDAGREGELIFRLVYNYAKCKNQFTDFGSVLWRMPLSGMDLSTCVPVKIMTRFILLLYAEPEQTGSWGSMRRGFFRSLWRHFECRTCNDAYARSFWFSGNWI